MKYSDYIIYVDESGDHSLGNTDPDYPMFVLVFCIIKKSDYYNIITPAIQKLKFDFFGHDMVILHEHEIRKSKPPYTFLLNAEKRLQFMSRLNLIITEAPITLVTSVVNKTKLYSQYAKPDNPYELALLFCMERTYKFLEDLGQAEQLTHVVVESRGKKENKDLELEFRRICQKNNFHHKQYPFELIMTDKQRNSGGLQLADLLARPIGIKTLNPNQPNRAFEIIQTKFRQSPSGKIEGWGLKYFP